MPDPERVTPELPDPVCPMGYPYEQLKDILGSSARIGQLSAFLTGQTVGLCSGEQYNYDTQKMEPTSCEVPGHGAVVYTVDLDNFLKNRPVTD